MIKNFQLSTVDELPLNGRVSLSTNPKGAIVLVHGFREHMGRYEHFFEFFNQADLHVITIDLRGHGISGGKRANIPSYEHLLGDIHLLTQYAQNEFPGMPLILYGQSMGGNIVANYLIKYAGHPYFSSVITSPWFKLAFEPPRIKIAIGKFIRRIWPSFTQYEPLDSTALSSDEQIGAAFKSDPLINNKVGTELYFSIVENGLWALNNAHRLQTPTLLLHGEADSITSIAATREFALLSGHKLLTFSGLKHELHNEIQKEIVLQEILEWINYQLKNNTPNRL